MLYFSVWMTLVLLLGVLAMFYVAKTVGGGSARYFREQQKAVADMEGFAQEMMNGQKVIKVFNREQQSIRDFDEVNNNLFEVSFRAHAFASVLGPIISNIGNILYVGLALAGGVFILAGVLGSARMILRQHTLGQVVGGFLIGMACSVVGIIYL
jgi:ATP-binding cassette subfamily B protein